MADLDATRRQLDDANSEIRQLLQQRADLRKERDLAFEEGARSMRDRAAACAEDDPTAEYDIRRQIRALPLLPDAPEKCAGMFSGGEGVASLCDGPAGHDGGCHPRLAEDFDAGWSAGHTHARADADRVAQLEEQYADLASLVHGHGEDIGQAQAALRGLGQRLTRMEPPA